MEISVQGQTICIKGDEYELSIDGSAQPRARLAFRGALVADLYLASSCHADGQLDVLVEVRKPEVKPTDGSIVVEIEARSSLWPRKTFVLECFPEHLEYGYRVYGRGAIDDCLFFAGCPSSGGQPEMSTPYFRRLFSPEPNADRQQYMPPSERPIIGVRSDKCHRHGSWFFTPAPFCFGLEAAPGDWLAVGLLARPDELNFASYEYLPASSLTASDYACHSRARPSRHSEAAAEESGAGRGPHTTPDPSLRLRVTDTTTRPEQMQFGLRLAYEGQTKVSGVWESPRVAFLPANGEYEAVATYCAHLFRFGFARRNTAQQYDWWSEPIFCGWGQQVNMAARLYYDGGDLASRAAAYATQPGYERFLDRLEARGLRPGIVVVDDKWQGQYGLNWPDRAKWPYMESFVSCQHQLGRKVLLWLKAWDPEGVPVDECLLAESDKGNSRIALAVDPGNEEYQSRLRAQVRRMLAELKVDGFKIDFTHKLPTGKPLRNSTGPWGAALLKTYLQTIYDEAKQTKSDALVMTHTANPYFADVVDMIRLNDMANIDDDEGYLASMRHRARVARAAAPHWLIDTDNWPSPSKRAWREYVAAQPELGVPSLYYVSGVSYVKGNGQLSEEEFDDADYDLVAQAWEKHRRNGN